MQMFCWRRLGEGEGGGGGGGAALLFCIHCDLPNVLSERYLPLLYKIGQLTKLEQFLHS